MGSYAMQLCNDIYAPLGGDSEACAPLDPPVRFSSIPVWPFQNYLQSVSLQCQAFVALFGFKTVEIIMYFVLKNIPILVWIVILKHFRASQENKSWD